MQQAHIRPAAGSIAVVLFVLATAAPRPGCAVVSLLEDNEPWIGDFDEMKERRLIRFLVPYSQMFYFLDGATQRGLTYEFIDQFDTYLNKKLGKKILKVRIVIIPTPRDELIPGLLEGLGDVAAGNITITPERRKQVDFADSQTRAFEELLVSGPTAPQIRTLEDLAGQEVFVRESSSYRESLQELNDRFKREKKKPVKIIAADEYLETEDILEMVNAGLVDLTVADSHIANFWKEIFDDITVHTDIPLRTEAQASWAFRRSSPLLKKELDEFGKTVKQGTLTGNILLKKYLEENKWVRNASASADYKRFQNAAGFFQKYSKQYEFDWLMIAALAYQESRIDQSVRSSAGAVGVMQLLPSTAKDRNVNISNIYELENNIHAGVKYLRFLRNYYFEKEPMDDVNKTLFTFASYNAGPGRVASLRKEAQRSGLDPFVWFDNVEIIAAKRIGRETVHYVGNIYQYYIAYRLIREKEKTKEALKEGES